MTRLFLIVALAAACIGQTWGPDLQYTVQSVGQPPVGYWDQRLSLSTDAVLVGTCLPDGGGCTSRGWFSVGGAPRTVVANPCGYGGYNAEVFAGSQVGLVVGLWSTDVDHVCALVKGDTCDLLPAYYYVSAVSDSGMVAGVRWADGVVETWDAGVLSVTGFVAKNNTDLFVRGKLVAGTSPDGVWLFDASDGTATALPPAPVGGMVEAVGLDAAGRVLVNIDAGGYVVWCLYDGGWGPVMNYNGAPMVGLTADGCSLTTWWDPLPGDPYHCCLAVYNHATATLQRVVCADTSWGWYPRPHSISDGKWILGRGLDQNAILYLPANLGDVDGDGAVTFADIDPFVGAIGGDQKPAADCNGDGRVGFADIDPFVTKLMP